MATSRTDIFNMALSAAQERASITNPDENTKAANLCRLWYPTARRRSLKAGMWPCATSYSRLALLTSRDESEWTEAEPAPGFQYAYALPTGLLAPQRLYSGMPFERALYAGQPALMTNEAQAVLRYTLDQTVIEYWDEGLVMTVVHYLAALMVKNLNGKLSLYDRLAEEAADHARTAGAEIGNEENVEQITLPPNVAARGYAGTPAQTVYYHPLFSLNGIAA